MSWREYPSEADWIALSAGFDWTRLDLRGKRISIPTTSPSSIITFRKDIECDGWFFTLMNRLGDVHVSYIMSQFYFTKGIPDVPHFVSPGRDGVSVQYFPNFQENHYTRKHQFDYFVDVFYYKLFSAADTIGHILNAAFDLQIRKVYLNGFLLNALAESQGGLSERLREILDSRAFIAARKYRIAITHNSPPNEAGPFAIRPFEGGFSMGIREYTSCQEFLSNMTDVLGDFSRILSALNEFDLLINR